MMAWLRHLSIFVCLLAIIGAGLGDGFALAQRNVASPLETIVAEIPITTPNPASHALQVGCAVQVVCSIFIAVTDVRPERKRESNGIPAGFRSQMSGCTSVTAMKMEQIT